MWVRYPCGGGAPVGPPHAAAIPTGYTVTKTDVTLSLQDTLECGNPLTHCMDGCCSAACMLVFVCCNRFGTYDLYGMAERIAAAAVHRCGRAHRGPHRILSELNTPERVHDAMPVVRSRVYALNEDLSESGGGPVRGANVRPRAPRIRQRCVGCV